MRMKECREQAADIDVEALRAKYKAERDKRIREEGHDQYAESSGEFARFHDEDPFVEPGFARPPMNDEIEVLIIGAGWSGLLTAARLRQAGLSDVRVIDLAADFGGTWYWNRYPGAQCDVESYIYMPALEETDYIPAEKYAHQPEIFEHARRIARTFGVYEGAIFGTRVEGMRWDAADGRWHVTTDRDDHLRARFVVLASGTINRPKLPRIPGIGSFAGRTFHTCRWDYDYTGGSESGNLHKLVDKRVAVIGTGASAIQVVPHLGESAERLYVFQRTPSSVDVRGNKPTDRQWAQQLCPGWQVERQENFDAVVGGFPFEEDLVSDTWTDLFRNLQSMLVAGHEGSDAELMAELADFRKMNQIRGRVDAMVADPEVAERLKPWYRQFCKRPTFSDEYLLTFNRPNVTLVDTSDSRGVERITAIGVVANGTEYPVDCIVFATGFEIGATFERRVGVTIEGEGGRSLFDHWKDGLRTLHGHSAHGFPNWFYIGNSQNGQSANYGSVVDPQAMHLAYIIAEARNRGATRVEATVEGEAEWVATIRRLSPDRRKYLETCTPGHYNNEGQSGMGAFDIYGPGATAFKTLMAEWRAAGDLAGLRLSA